VWDETKETNHRLHQVWFAGVHSDVGGGYPEDSLSYVSLDWMMAEAASNGLFFKPGGQAEVRSLMDPDGVKHDSRRGLAAYYRYQPRKIASWLGSIDPTTRIMRDPRPSQSAQLKEVFVHDSVLRRIESGSDEYAPIVLPGSFTVVSTKSPAGLSGSPRVISDPDRADRQEWVWNDVWRRRVGYFCTVGISLLLLVLPVWQQFVPPSACNGPQCLAATPIAAAATVLPSFFAPWLDAFSRAPGFVLLALAAIAFLMARSGRLQCTIGDGMRELWKQSLQLEPREAAVTLAGKSSGHPTGHWIWKLRSKDTYQESLRALKWTWLPGFFGVAGLGLLLVLGVYIVFVLASRTTFAIYNYVGAICTATPTAARADGQSQPTANFQTRDLCWPSGLLLEEGRRYRVQLRVRPQEDWIDGSIPAGPEGFPSNRMAWYARVSGTPLRRSLADPWFKPMVRIGARDGFEQPLDFKPAGEAGVVAAEFSAPRSGELFIFVNDVVVGWEPDRYYKCAPGNERSCNRGTAVILVSPLH
jgi:hypothetical protein